MPNRDLSYARRYHEGTKHSWQSVQSSTHRLDWSNEPRPFKLYPQIEGQPLPTELPESGCPAFSALQLPPSSREMTPTQRDLAGLLYYAAGITKMGVVAGGRIYFRAAACTGALFHIEIYLVCGELPDLAAGVYHFGPHDFALRQLRPGDYRETLVEASGGDPALAQAPAALVTTSVYWRNSWKYQARAYRHAYWDSGTILANLLTAGSARQVPLKIVTTFVDDPVNRLLGLAEGREASLQLVPLGCDPGTIIPDPPPLVPLQAEVAPYSRQEVDYPAMGEMHYGSSLESAAEVAELRATPPKPTATSPQGPLFPLEPLPAEELPGEAIESVIYRRGSSRRFRQAPITRAQLATMLRAAAGDLPADFLPEPGATLNQLYLVVNDVTGLPPGSYRYHPELGALEQLKAGEFREQAGYLGLGQELPRDASVDVFFLADLAAALEQYGNRGYRLAQVEASIRGGKLYLAAYALRLGASGLTFFDDDVTEFFSPQARGRSPMFLVALGRPVRRR